MSTDEPMATAVVEKPKTKEGRAIVILEEALSGHSGKSKNTLIGEAIEVLKE